jgi:hypothetical protein
MVKRIETLEESLGEERFQEILEKDWKTAELPTPEELAKKESKSPKARNNMNSLKNLSQYNPNKSKELKEKIVKNLTVTVTEEDVDPKTILDPRHDIDMINNLLPVKQILVSAEEQRLYWTKLNLFLKDFDPDELNYSDYDNIIQIVKNSIMEFRLLKLVVGNGKMLLDISNAVERLNKNSDKLRENLANRRVDRVDTSRKSGFSIVDAASAFDETKKKEYDQRVADLQKKEAEYPHKTRE